MTYGAPSSSSSHTIRCDRDLLRWWTVSTECSALRRVRNQLRDFAEADAFGRTRKVARAQLAGRLLQIAHDARVKADPKAHAPDAGLLDILPWKRAFHRPDEKVDRLRRD